MYLNIRIRLIFITGRYAIIMYKKWPNDLSCIHLWFFKLEYDLNNCCYKNNKFILFFCYHSIKLAISKVQIS